MSLVKGTETKKKQKKPIGEFGAQISRINNFKKGQCVKMLFFAVLFGFLKERDMET